MNYNIFLQKRREESSFGSFQKNNQPPTGRHSPSVGFQPYAKKNATKCPMQKIKYRKFISSTKKTSYH